MAFMDQRAHRAHVAGALRRDHRDLGQMPAQAVEQLGALGNQHLPRFMLHQDGLRNAFSARSKWRIKSYSSAPQKRQAPAAPVYC